MCCPETLLGPDGVTDCTAPAKAFMNSDGILHFHSYRPHFVNLYQRI